MKERKAVEKRIADYRREVGILVSDKEVGGSPLLHDKVCTFVLTAPSADVAVERFCDEIAGGIARRHYETIAEAVRGIIHVYRTGGEWIKWMVPLGNIETPSAPVALGIMQALGPARFWVPGEGTQRYDRGILAAPASNCDLPIGGAIARQLIFPEGKALRTSVVSSDMERALSRAAKGYVGNDDSIVPRSIPQHPLRVSDARGLMRCLEMHRAQERLTPAGAVVQEALEFGLFGIMTNAERYALTERDPQELLREVADLRRRTAAANKALKS